MWLSLGIRPEVTRPGLSKVSHKEGPPDKLFGFDPSDIKVAQG